MRRRILRYKEPLDKEGYWSLWIVYFDAGDGKEFSSYMYQDEFKVLMKEEELIKKGYLLKDLKDYRELVGKFERREMYDNEGQY